MYDEQPIQRSIQEYDLPLGELRLADFAGDDAPEFFHSVFDLTESVGVPGRTALLRDFNFGHIVADLTSKAGFDGMIVRGVRGESNYHYKNVVVFEPADYWKTWSRQDDGFNRL